MDDIILIGGLIFAAVFLLLVVAVYLDSLKNLYYRKVNFRIADIEVTYWYKWKLFSIRNTTYFIWRKLKLYNHTTNMTVEHILDPVHEDGHILYFYFDYNYTTETGMLFDALVVRDAVISMGFDVYSLDYLDTAYVYKKKEEQTEYLGMIERGKFYDSDGFFRDVKSRELNY